MENNLHKQTVLDMIQQHATRVRTSRYQRSNLMAALALVCDELEDTSPVSSAELETIRQLRFEQEASSRSWSTCCIVTTILYNLVAASESPRLFSLKRRSYKTIFKLLKNIESEDTSKRVKK